MSHRKVNADIDREDFMIKVRGVPVFPRHIETILSESTVLTGNCQIVVDKRTPRQEMLLKVETNKQLSNWEKAGLKAQIIEQVKNRIGVTLNDLTFVPKRTFEGKFPKTVTVS
jgi:phenylacetate-coenzyme A ligase PaaK-like adenylate-forming protein